MKLPYDLVCPSSGWSACHNFLNGRRSFTSKQHIQSPSGLCRADYLFQFIWECHWNWVTRSQTIFISGNSDRFITLKPNRNNSIHQILTWARRGDWRLVTDIPTWHTYGREVEYSFWGEYFFTHSERQTCGYQIIHIVKARHQISVTNTVIGVFLFHYQYKLQQC